MKPDLFEAPDYYNLDDLLTDEHKLIRDTARAWVKRDVSPIIEEAAQNATFPKSIIPGLAEIGAFGPYIPEEYGGAGLDQISYGLIMQEIERGDSGVRSTASVQSSLVMYPIWKYGNEAQRKSTYPNWPLGNGWVRLDLPNPIMEATQEAWSLISRIRAIITCSMALSFGFPIRLSVMWPWYGPKTKADVSMD